MRMMQGLLPQPALVADTLPAWRVAYGAVMPVERLPP